MPIEIHLVKKPYGLIPQTPADEEELSCFPDNARVKATITRSKSLQMLRLYWAVVEEVAKGIGNDKTGLSNQLLWHTKRYDAIIVDGGRVAVATRRISQMDYKELGEYVSAAFGVLQDYLGRDEWPEVVRIAERRAGTTYLKAADEIKQKEMRDAA